MSTIPTRSQCETMLGLAIKVIDQQYLWGSKNATNLDTLIKNFQNSPLFGDFSPDAAAAMAGLRSLASGAMSRATAQSVLRPLIRMYMEDVVGRTDLSTDQAMLAEWYKYYVDNKLRVTGRGITYGTPTAKSGVTMIGTVQLLRLTTDRYNFPIESTALDAKRCRCIVDQNTGANGQGNESWLLEGQVPPPDDLLRSGSGLSTIITGLTADQSILSNADFRQFSATTVVANGLTTTVNDPSGVTDWVSTANVTNSYQMDNTPSSIFRVAPSNTLANAYALNIVATSILSQKLSLKNTKLNPDVPYVLAVVWNAQIGSAVGTLKIRMGNTETVVTVNGQTGWQVTTCPPNRGWSNWYQVFAQNDLQVAIDWTQTSGNGIRIAEVLFVPASPASSNGYFDGWFWMLPNSTANWVAPRILDEFDFADMITGADAKNQRTLGYAFPGFYLPSAVGSGITWVDS